MKKKIKCYTYTRVSTAMQVDGYSLDAQKEKLKRYADYEVNLNIDQVKQKRGIIERENYNKPKSENSRQPGCPEEKVKAIEEALKFFQMI